MLCWCDSGVEFDQCHRGREDQVPVSPFERHRAGRIYQRGKCLHPNASAGCGPTIRAHGVQRAMLSAIAEEGKVYCFMPEFGESQVVPRLFGVNQASIFRGFCQEHDALFDPIEKGNVIDFSDQQNFLFAFRAVSRELHFKIGEEQYIQWAKLNADRGKSRAEQERIQAFLNYQRMGAHLGREDVQKAKAVLDRYLLKNRFDEIRSLVLETDPHPPILASFALQPDCDFKGNVLQDQALIDVRMEKLFVSSIATPGGGAIILSWLRGSTAPVRFIKSLLDMSREDMPDALIRFLIEASESICIAPAWWDSLGWEEKAVMIRRFNDYITAVREGSRKTTYLADDGVRVANFRIKRVRQPRDFLLGLT